MATTTDPERTKRALLVALSRNRGELDPVKLERLLRLLAAPKTA
jgi:hypothetical protein